MTTDTPILSDAEWALWLRQYGHGLTQDMFDEFRLVAEKKRLNPFERQITARVQKTKNGPRLVIITNIDGYRAVADRTGAYAGNDDAIIDTGSGGPYPLSAKVTVYKMVAGQRCPFSATARWAEYYPGDSMAGQMYRNMPTVMIGKCAEALALRKGFPEELSGLYTDAEMQQAEIESPPQTETHAAPPEPTVHMVSDDEKRALIVSVQAHLRNHGGDPDFAAVLIKTITSRVLGKPRIQTIDDLNAVEGAILSGQYTLDSGEPIPQEGGSNGQL